MERQVKQLKINARNIQSFLSKSNRTLRKHRQDRKKFDIRQTTIQKQKLKESKIESTRSPIKKSTNAISGTVKKGARGIFGMLGGVMDFITAVVLGNAVSNIEKIGSWLNKIGFDKIFKGISNFINMLAQGATNLLAKAVKLPEEFPDTSKEKPQNKVKPLTTGNGDKGDKSDITSKIDKNSWAERMFPKSEQKAAQEGSDIINKMFGHEVNDDDKQALSSATNELSSLFGMNEVSDASKLIASSFSGDPMAGLYNSDLDQESVDHLIIMTQKVLVG